MTAQALVAAVQAAAAYADNEERGVVIVAARSCDLAGRWIIVEGVKKAFRRVYVVDLAPAAPTVFEPLGVAPGTPDADLIAAALARSNSVPPHLRGTRRSLESTARPTT